MSEANISASRPRAPARPKALPLRALTALALLLLALPLLAAPARAECYADYKAKKDAPLRLHYGIIRLEGARCRDPGKRRAEIARRIAKDGWVLLNVISVFDAGGLDDRRANAGEYFLRY